jgi:tRNA threonylcarbamoyladenosine biosynthesis protein TsaE
VDLTIRTATPEDTRAAGAELAEVLGPRDVIVLTGELGAGKTTLTRGIVHGLGATEHVASPTFTLVREYVTGRLPVAHVDVYRLRRAQDVVDLALDELEGGHEGVLLVEWGDAVAELLGPERLRIELSTSAPPDETRTIRLTATGPSWADRWIALEADLAAWEPVP